MIKDNKENRSAIDSMMQYLSGMSLKKLSEISVTGLDGGALHRSLSIVASYALLHVRARMLHRRERDYIYYSDKRPTFVRGVILLSMFKEYYGNIRFIVHVEYSIMAFSFLMAVRSVRCSELPPIVLFIGESIANFAEMLSVSDIDMNCLNEPEGNIDKVDCRLILATMKES